MAILPTITFALAALTPLISAETISIAPKVTSVQTSGNGCARGSVTAKGTLNELNLDYNHFAAASPGRTSTTNCEVFLQSSGATSGYQVAVSALTISGSADLTAGTDAQYIAQVFWQADASNTATFQASSNKNGGVSVRLNSDKLAWSPCMGNEGNPGLLAINTRVALGLNTNNAVVVDKNSVSFAYRKC